MRKTPAMRTSIGVLLALAVLVAATAGAGVATGATGYASCSGGFNPDGTSGAFYTRIRAKRVSCRTARSVVKAWVVKQAASDGANPVGTTKVKGYTCRGRSYGGSADADGGLAVTCKHGSRHVITFIGHP